MAVYSYWAQTKEIDLVDPDDQMLLGAILACLTVRKAAKLAYSKKFIGLIAPDIIEYIIEAFKEIALKY